MEEIKIPDVELNASDIDESSVPDEVIQEILGEEVAEESEEVTAE